MARVSGAMRRALADGVRRGDYTQAQADEALGLEPGEHLAPSGVVTGSGAHPEIPRFGADQTDNDHLPDADR